MKALWLTSWYPHKKDKFTGDFIQRHAFATSLYTQVQVIHVQVVNDLAEKIDISYTEHKNLKEHIILLRASKMLFPFNKIADYFNYFKSYKKYINQYLKKEGKPDIIHVHITMKAGLIALYLKKKLNIPFVVTEHWTIYTSNAPDCIENRSALYKFVNRQILKKASLLLPDSADLGMNIQKKIYPVASQRIINVVDTELFHYSPKLHANEFIFLHVSTMNEQKNPEGILRAFSMLCKEMQHIKLYMVGPVTDELKALAISLEIPPSSIEFPGEVPYQKVAEYMQLANALVMFSNYENMPCVILEALCSGLPVISSTVGGIAEIINESNGYLVPARDEQALYETMLALVKSYHQFNLAKISEKTMHLSSYQTVGKEIAQVYEKILRTKFN